MAARARTTTAVAVTIVALAVGCGDGSRGGADSGPPVDGGPRDAGGGGGDAAPTDSGSDASRDAGEDAGTADSRQFVPDIPMTYEGSIEDPGVEIVGFTAYEAFLNPRFLVALENVSSDINLCSLDMTTRFDDASGTEIAIARGLVETPPHRGVSGTGDLLNCLGPGQIGMQAVRLELSTGSSIDDIVAGRWEVGAINVTDAVPTTDLDVRNVMRVADGSLYQFIGELHNLSSETVENPDVSVFGVNEVGRPIVEGSDIELTSIGPGGSWSFTTLSFEDRPFVDIVAFPEARSL